MNINDLLLQLASDNSRIFKENLLTQHKDNELLKQVIFLALDPFTQFYIRKIPAYVTTDQETETIDWALHQLSVLSMRQKTGNAAIEHLQKILSSINPNDAKVIERIIEKDLKCGVSVSTVNKIWPKMIHEFPVMLASSFDEKALEKFAFPAISQAKLDGMRCNVVVENGKVALFSRNGKPLEVYGNFDQAFLEMSEGHDAMFDGELMVLRDGKFLDRKTGNGICNRAVKGTIPESEANELHIVLYDYVDDLDAWRKGVHKTPYHKRITDLSKIIDKHHEWQFKASLVEGRIVNNRDDAFDHFQEQIIDGGEGTIVKAPLGIWEDKRSKGLLKIKSEHVNEMRVVGWEEGTGKNVGLLGNLIVQSEDGLIECGVGSGFSDEQRKLFTKDEVLDKIVSIKYNGRIQAKGDKKESLFLPIFLEIREDKDLADDSSAFSYN
jgi:ATP-dependent DNA ligase